MQRQENDHRLRHEMVQSAQQPAADHLMLNEVHALPRGLAAGTITHPKKNAGDYLCREGEYQRASPDIAPARATGYVLIERGMGQLTISGAVVEPIEKGAHHLGIFSAIPV